MHIARAESGHCWSRLSHALTWSVHSAGAGRRELPCEGVAAGAGVERGLRGALPCPACRGRLCGAGSAERPLGRLAGERALTAVLRSVGGERLLLRGWCAPWRAPGGGTGGGAAAPRRRACAGRSTPCRGLPGARTARHASWESCRGVPSWPCEAARGARVSPERGGRRARSHALARAWPPRCGAPRRCCCTALTTSRGCSWTRSRRSGVVVLGAPVTNFFARPTSRAARRLPAAATPSSACCPARC